MEDYQKSENYFEFAPTFWDIIENSQFIPFLPNENNYYNNNEYDFQKQIDNEILERIENGKLRLIFKESEEKENFSNFKIVENLKESHTPLQMEENIKEKEFEEKKEKNEIFEKKIKILKKSTEGHTDITSNDIDRIIFDVKGQREIEPRIDYAIKNIKVYISKFIKIYGNELIRNCNFQSRLRNTKLFSPSYYYFTGNSNIKDNTVFLYFTVEQILTYPEKATKKGEKLKKDNRLQRKNKEIINDIKNYIETKYPKEVPDKFQELLNFFKITYEEIVNLFYKSNHFKEYSSSLKTRKLDEIFIKTKEFSLLENNGFIKLMKKNEENNI